MVQAQHAPDNLKLDALMGIFGFTLFLMWYFCTMFWVCPSFSPQQASIAPEAQALIPQAALMAGSVAATLLLSVKAVYLRLSSSLAQQLSVYSCTALGLTPALIMLLTPQTTLTFVLFSICSFLAGIATVLLFAMWENISMESSTDNIVTYLGSAFCASNLLFCILRLSYLQDNAAVLTMLFLVGSSALIFVMRHARESDEPLDCDEGPDVLPHTPDPSPRRTHDLFENNAIFTLIGLGFGIALAALTSCNRLYLVAGFVGGLLLSAAILKRQRDNADAFSIRQLEMLCAGAQVTCTIVAASTRIFAVTVIGAAVITAFWFTFRSLNGGLLMRHALQNGYPSVRYLAQSKACINCGILGGWLVVLAMRLLGMDSQAYLYFASAVAVVLTLFCFTCFAAASSAAASASATLNAGASAIPAARISLEKSTSELDEKTPEPAAAPSLTQACAQAAKLFRLSPREEEILHYLARGRNARYIAEDLMISEHTANSHISRIYRKMNVHSRQDLIDLIESTPTSSL